ncbi:MAG: complex I subunit 5 family protein [Patescibacteria group bacterium]
MTPFENTLYVAMVAPVLALVVSAFLKPAMSFRWNSLLIALSGIGGVIAGAYGAVAEAPFTMAVPMFYGMTIALDRFSAIFFLAISIVIAAAGLYALVYGVRHQGSPTHLRLVGILTALIVIGTQWVLISGNSIGFIAAWAVMTLSVFFLTLLPMSEQHKSVAIRFLTVSQLGVASITAGLFILSSGALFSDFGTLAYLAGQIEPTQLIVGYGLLLFGFATTIGLFPMHRWFRNVLTIVPAHNAVLLRGTLSGVAFYGFIRCILFILPPLSIWFALPVALLGVLTIICGAVCALNEKNIQRIFSNITLQGLGVAATMVAGAMAFQAVAIYDAMNVMLFAAFVQIVVSAIAGSGLFLVGDVVGSNIDRSGGLATKMPKLTLAAFILMFCAIGFPPFATFTSAWMFATTLGTTFRAVELPLAIVCIAILVIFILCLLVSIVSIGRVIIGVFLGTSRSESDAVVTEATDSQLTPIVLLAFLALVSGFALPQLFVAIGADPLTDAAGTFNGGIVTAAGTLRMGIIGIVVGAIALMKWYFRASWIDRIPTFTGIETCRTNIMNRFTIGNRLRKVWNGALEKLRR